MSTDTQPVFAIVLCDQHHRISGVSSSCRALLPFFKRSHRLWFWARQAQDDVPAQSLHQIFHQLAAEPSTGVIWHARRNNELLMGIVLRFFSRRRVSVVFTSAAIRRHSWWPRKLIQAADAVIATSQAAASFVQPVAAIVPHGVDIERFSHALPWAGEAPWRAYSLCIGMIGRIRPEKGSDLMIQALIDTLPSHPNACALMVGKTTAKYLPLLQAMRQQLQQAGLSDRVFFLEEVPFSQMPSLYRELDIVACPARYEGFGLVPLEAMCSGTAIIASKTGAYPDILEDGVNGILIDTHNQSALSNALARLLADDQYRIQLQQQGAQRVGHFSIAHEHQSISKVYQRLMDAQEQP